MNTRYYQPTHRVRLEYPEGMPAQVSSAMDAIHCCTGGGGGSAPSRNLYQETSDTLNAELNLAPSVFAAESQYTPQLNTLNLQNLQQFLEGAPEGTRQVPVTTTQQGWRNTVTGAFTTTKPLTDSNGYGYSKTGKNAGRGQIDVTGGQWVPWSQQSSSTQTVATPASEGFLSLLQRVNPQINALTTSANTAQRAADVTDVANLTPQALTAIRSANPAQAKLLDTLTQSAQQQLDAGASLDPVLAKETTQAVRGAQAARGLGMGPSDVLGESRALTDLGNSLRQQREQFATGVVGLNQDTTTTPILNLLTRLSSNPTATQNLVSMGMSPQYQAAPITFDPLNSYAQDLYNTNYNASASQNIANKNASAATNSALISGGVGVAAIAAIAL